VLWMATSATAPGASAQPEPPPARKAVRSRIKPADI
jgi:hypothetical protein